MSKKQLTRAYLIPVIFILSIVVLVANYHFREINLSIPAKSLSDGNKVVLIRALNLNSGDQIHVSNITDAKVNNKYLYIKWRLPKEIKENVALEVCVPGLGFDLDNEQCFKEVGSLESASKDMDGDTLNSCRYLLDYSKTSIWSKLRNDDNGFGGMYDQTCQKDLGRKVNPDKKDNIGMSLDGYIGKGLSSDGLLMVKDGVLESIKPEDVFNVNSNNMDGYIEDNINNTYQTISYYPANISNYYTTNNSQVLTLSGETLSLSGGGGSVIIPSDPVANSNTTGLLNSIDYNNFAAKENTLIFDSSFIRSGNNISLMSCLTDEVLKNDGIGWVCANDIAGPSYNAGIGLGVSGNTFNNTGLLSISPSGALMSSLGQNPVLSLNSTSNLTQDGGVLDLSDIAGLTPGTYNNLTVDSKGRVTAGTNVSYLISESDGVVGNEVSDVIDTSGLVMIGSGTNVDPYKVGLITSCSNNQILKYTAAGGWDCAVDVDTDTQGLTYNTNTNILGINGNASTVNLTPYLDNTDSQTLSMINLSDGNHSISISGGNSQNWSESQGLTYNATNNILGINGNSSTVNLTPYLDNTDSQTLSYNATTRTISLTNGGSVILPPDQDTTYTAGTGISIISGSISSTLGTDVNSAEIVDGTVVASDLANTGATAGSYGDSGVNVAQLTVNAQGQVTAVSNRSLLTATSTTTGVLSSADWTNFNAKENVLTFNGPLTRSGNTIGLTPCGNGQYYQYNGVGWVCTNGVVGSSYSAGSGLSLSSNVFSVNCSSATAVVFCQNGNNFGANAVIGTNDSFALSFETNNTTAATLSSTGEFLMRDPSNANGAFQVQNASSLPHFSVDTVNNRVLIGSNTTDVNSIALVLDSYNNVADPVSAAVNGAMYYNSSLNKFRCYENSAWVDCISSFPQILVEANRTTALTPTLTSTILPFNNATVNVGTTYNTATGLFTAPSTGIYEFETNVTMNYPTSSVLTSNRGDWYIELYNSSAASVLQQVWHGETNSTAGAQANSTNISTKKISLIAGQQVGIRIAVMNVSGPARTLYTTMPTANSIQITRIK